MRLKNRDKFINIVIWCIVIAFVTTIFASFGRYNMAQKGNRNPVAIEVNGEEISRALYFQRVDEKKEQYKNYYNTSELSDTVILEIRKITADELIGELALTELSEEYNINANIDEIRQGVLRQFVNEKGEFNREQFEQLKQHYPANWWENFEAEIARNIINNKSRLIVTDKVKITELETKNYYTTYNMQAKIQQLFLDPTKLIDTSTAQVYYDDNINSFVKPEKRFVRRIIISDTDLTNDTAGSIERIKINNIYNKLLSGEKFADMANQYSDEPFTFTDKLYKDGEIGYVTMQSEYSRNFISAVFSLNLYQISDVIRTDKGYQILQVTEIADTEHYDFDEVQQRIARSLVTDTEYEILNDKLKNIKTKIVSNETDFEKMITEFSDADSKDSDGIVGYIPRIEFPMDYIIDPENRNVFYEIPIDVVSRQTYQLPRNFSDSVFTLKQDELSEPIKSKYGYHLIKVIDYKIPEQKEFDSEYEEVYNTLISMKRNNMFSEWLEDWKKTADIEYNIQEYLDKVNPDEEEES